MATLLSPSSPLPWATKAPSLTPGRATLPCCVSSPPAGTVSVPSFSSSDWTTSDPGTVAAPPARLSNRCGPRPEMKTPTVPLTERLPAFWSVPSPTIPMLPSDQVVVPPSRRVWVVICTAPSMLVVEPAP